MDWLKDYLAAENLYTEAFPLSLCNMTSMSTSLVNKWASSALADQRHLTAKPLSGKLDATTGTLQMVLPNPKVLTCSTVSR